MRLAFWRGPEAPSPADAPAPTSAPEPPLEGWYWGGGYYITMFQGRLEETAKVLQAELGGAVRCRFNNRLKKVEVLADEHPLATLSIEGECGIPEHATVVLYSDARSLRPLFTEALAYPDKEWWPEEIASLPVWVPMSAVDEQLRKRFDVRITFRDALLG